MSLRDASKWTIRETAHLNGGAKWFGYDFVVVEEPRITRHLRCYRKTRTSVVTWKVDGHIVTSFAEALAVVGAYISVTGQ